MEQKRMGNAAWGFRRLKLSEQLAITARMGMGIHELGIANAETDVPLEVSEKELENVRTLYRQYGIKLVCAATGNDFTVTCKEQVWQDVDKIKKVTDIGEKLGIRYLRIFAGFSRAYEVTEDRWEQMLEAMCQVADYAVEKGVTLCMETHGGVSTFPEGVLHFPSVTTQPDLLRKLLGELPPALKLVYDPGNLYAAGVTHPESLYLEIKERVGYVHLKDFVRTESGYLIPAACGEGDMDWKPVLKQLKDFTGPVLAEYEVPEDVEQGSRRCFDFLETFDENF